MGEPSDNLYVTNLPSGLEESMVSQFFSIYGTVTSCKVLKNPIATGKTAALVRFASIEEATSILQTLNGTVPTGLEEPVQVKFASKKVEPAVKGAGKGAWEAPPSLAQGGMGKMGAMGAAKGGYGKWDGKWDGGGAAAHAAAAPYFAAGQQNGGWEPEISDNIYIQGLPAGTTDESLRQTFMEFGNIKTLKLLPSKFPDSPCAALIRYDSTETAKLTKEILNGQTPEGFPGPLIVRYANKPGEEQGGDAWTSKGGGAGAWGMSAGAAAAAVKGAWQAVQQVQQ